MPHKRIDEIEVLRALAIILTLMHHSFSSLFIFRMDVREQLYAHFTLWGGVDVFFVVSGFVIARDFFARQKRAPASTPFWRITAAFWVRRAFRILPSAWLWLGLFLLANAYLTYTTSFGPFHLNLGDTIAALLQYANFHQYECAQRTAQCGLNSAYWSLSLEEQFYFVLPFLIFASRKYLPVVLSVIFIGQFLIPRPEWSLGWAFRTDGFILGVLLAIWSAKESYYKWAPAVLARSSWLRGACVSALVFAMLVIPAPPNKISLAVGILSLVCAVLVWMASYGQGYLMKPGALRNILVAIGARSYAIYLTHIFANHLAIEFLFRTIPRGQIFTSDSAPVFATVALAMTLAFSEFNYRYIEKPLLLFGKRLSEKIQ
jgi:peptidoglycan/LPS O-acetylase OafA/YrhL